MNRRARRTFANRAAASLRAELVRFAGQCGVPTLGALPLPPGIWKGPRVGVPRSLRALYGRYITYGFSASRIEQRTRDLLELEDPRISEEARRELHARQQQERPR